MLSNFRCLLCAAALILPLASGPRSLPAEEGGAVTIPVIHAFPRDQHLVPGRLYSRHEGMGRVTIIAYHNGSIYTSNVAGGSPRRWQFTNPSDPGSFTLIDNPGSQMNTGDGSHGTYFTDNYLAAGILAQSPGVNIWQTRLNSYQPPSPAWMNNLPSRNNTYYPWEMPFAWHQYGSQNGEQIIRRGVGDPILRWNLRDQAGHMGKGILLGDLMIYVDDESEGGVTTFDLSPVFLDPPQPPILLDHLNRPEGLGTYLPFMWRHIVVMTSRSKRQVDFVDISDPRNLRLLPSLSIPMYGPGNNELYSQAQDEFVFTRRAKINMLPLLDNNPAEVVLEFDTVGDNFRPAGSVEGPIDTSQYMLPLGNLLITGGYSFGGGRDAVGVWAHQAEPDTRSPYVGFHRPYDGQSNFPIGAPISIVINETLHGPSIRNGTTIILRKQGETTPVSAYTSFSHDQILTLTPLEYLEPDTFYEVVIPAGGIQDAVGNGIIGHSFSFSTGTFGQPPVIEAVNLAGVPAGVDDTVTVSIQASDSQAGQLEYRLDRGDGSPRSAWQSSNSFAISYPSLGHYRVTVQVRNASTGIAATTTRTVSVLPAPVAVMPTSSGPVTLHQASRRVWTVDPDLCRVSVLNADSLELLAVYDLRPHLNGRKVEPLAVAHDAHGQVWISAQAGDALLVLDASDGSLIQAMDLGHGSAPRQVVASPDGEYILVTTSGRAAGNPLHGSLIRYQANDRSEQGRLPLGPTPHAIAVTAEGNRALVSRFISAEHHGQIWDVSLGGSLSLQGTVNLRRDRGPDENHIGRGVPNYIAAIAIEPAGRFAWYSAVKANTNRGDIFGSAQTHDSIVRPMIGRVEIHSGSAMVRRELNVNERGGETQRIDLDNADSPTAIAITPRGDDLFVALQGNDEVAVHDLLAIAAEPRNMSIKRPVWRLAAGSAPQGLVYDAQAERLWIKNFLTRDLSVVDLAAWQYDGSRNAQTTTIASGGPERLSSEVLHGKVLFYRASDLLGPEGASRHSLESYISCASCHIAGGEDGRVWDFTQRGEGLRNTIDLRGRSGIGHGNVHWSGNFDEIQDFELDIVNHFGGSGLLNHGDTPHDPLGEPNAGRSADLDALAAYVSSLGPATLPRSPQRESDGSLSAAALRGQALFHREDCHTCHDPRRGYTDSTLGTATLHDVGTLRTTSGGRLGGTLPGIDTPTLLGIWATPPYLHDGSAATIADVFRAVGGVVMQAESGSLSGGAQVVADSWGNWDDSAYGKAVVRFSGTGSLSINGIDGGSGGGLGMIAIRAIQGGNMRASINGSTVDFVAGTINGDNATWSWIRMDGVSLNAGTDNTLTITSLTDTGNRAVDAILVANAEQIAKTAPHRRVLDLVEAEQEDLIAYLRSLEGSYGRRIRVGRLADREWLIDPDDRAMEETHPTDQVYDNLLSEEDHTLIPLGGSN